ncbi:MAG: MBL fold metallo-hydrolase [Myxococcales bacterium]|nr:MBL fold metallo-hydrolase [Myxococcales bacterium]
MKLQVFQVTPSVWCFRRRSYLTCSYLVRRANGQIVMVDAGMDSSAQDVRDALARAFDATIKDVAAVLVTHWHNDHAAGAQVVQEQASAKIYYHAGDEPELLRTTASGGVRGWLAARVPEFGPLVLLKGLLGEATPRAVKADVLVNDGDQIEEDVMVIATPGHTKGHVSFFYEPERVLFAGDALAVIGGNLRFMARSVTLNLQDARQSMRKCLELPIEHVCPGHRAPLSKDVPARCAEMRALLTGSEHWPFFG